MRYISTLILLIVGSLLSGQTIWYEVYEHNLFDPFKGANMLELQPDSSFQIATDQQLFSISPHGGIKWISTYCNSDIWLSPTGLYSSGPLRHATFENGFSVAIAEEVLLYQLIYLDPEGNMLWFIDGEPFDQTWMDVQLLGNDMITSVELDYERQVIKRINQSGGLVWESDPIFVGYGLHSDIAISSDGNIISLAKDGGGLEVNRVDSNGVFIDSTLLSINLVPWSTKLVNTLDSNLLLVGRTTTNKNQMIKLSETGSVIWSKEFLFDSLGTSGLEDYGTAVSIIVLDDGGFFLVMDGVRTTTSFPAMAPVNRVYRFDANGNETFRKDWTDNIHSHVDHLFVKGSNDIIVSGMHYVLNSDSSVIRAHAFAARTDSLLTLDTPSCAINCVWPGDASVDGIVDNLDFLYVVASLGMTGPTRPGASLIWEPQRAPSNWLWSWDEHYRDRKHTDTDGNGVIDLNDTLAIAQNFGLTIGLRPGVGSADVDCEGIPLSFQVPDAASPGDTISVQVYLGTSDAPAEEILGVAFSSLPDETFVSSTYGISYVDSWMGDIGEDLLSMTRITEEGLLTASGLGDGSTTDGHGLITEFSHVLQDYIPGGGSTETVYAYFNPTDILVLGQTGKKLATCGFADSLAIYFINTGLDGSLLSDGIEIAPNPASSYTTINAGENGPIQYLELLDLAGRIVYRNRDLRSSGQQASTCQIDLNGLDAGLYLLRMQTSNGWYKAKLTVK